MRNLNQVTILAASIAAGSHPIQRGPVFVQAREEGNAAEVLAELKKNFQSFRDEQEKRLAALEETGASIEALNKAKTESDDAIKAIQDSVDDLAMQLVAGQMNGGISQEAKAHAEAMTVFMRVGEIRTDLKKSPDSNGGYLAPTEWDRTITDKLREVSPLRATFRVQPTSKKSFSKLYNLHGADAGWVGETDARPKTGTPTFASMEITTGEIYANPAATQEMLEDAEIDLETWLASEVKDSFSDMENAAFISGDGAKGKPLGYLTYAEGGTNAATHPLGAIKVVPTGDAAAITADALIDLVYDLPAIFQANASFMMNRKTLAKVRKLKDGDGNYLWEKSYQAGQPSTILGYPVIEVAEMPDVAANALPISFGDHNRAYVILDRRGVVLLRDPFTNKPYVQFYTTKRVGGALDNPEAVRLLKVAV